MHILPAKTTNVLRHVLNCAGRLIMRSRRIYHMSHVLRKLHCLHFELHVNGPMYAYKTTHTMAPSLLNCLISASKPVGNTLTKSTCSVQNCLEQIRISKIVAAILWNSITGEHLNRVRILLHLRNYWKSIFSMDVTDLEYDTYLNVILIWMLRFNDSSKHFK